MALKIYFHSGSKNFTELSLIDMQLYEQGIRYPVYEWYDDIGGGEGEEGAAPAPSCSGYASPKGRQCRGRRWGESRTLLFPPLGRVPALRTRGAPTRPGRFGLGEGSRGPDA